jgi:GDP-mannose 6-dehydrogenase
LAKVDHYHVVVVRSTVQPGTIVGRIQPMLEEFSGKRVGKDFGLCFQPEFLREGTSIKDYDNPPFTVVGADSPRSADALRAVFGRLPCDFITTDIGTAEILKYACNTFHALKITFANEIARICQPLAVDGRKVMELVCRDRHLNISPAYMRPGFAFGGSCLPKDLRALTYVARSKDVSVPMLDNVLASNRAHVQLAIEAVLARGRPHVGLIGLSFKAGTDDLRESPLVSLAETFIGKGIPLRIYDPEVHVSRLIGANRRFIEESIPHIASLMEERCETLVESAEIIVLARNDRTVLDVLRRSTRAGQSVLDLTGGARPEGLAAAYQGICW